MKKIGLILWSFVFIQPPAGDAKVDITKVNYAGWDDCYKMSNGLIELVVCPRIGGRVVHFSKVNKPSILLVNPALKGNLPPVREKPADGPIWHPWGAFLWVAPETPASFLFNEPFETEIKGNNKITMTGRPQAYSQTQKRVEIEMTQDRPEVRIDYFLKNTGTKSLRHAIWCSFIVANDGTVVAPMGAKSNVPVGIGKNNPIRPGHLYKVGGHLVFKRAEGTKDCLQFGTDPDDGWVSYHQDGTLFYKQFPLFAGMEYGGEGPLKVYSDVNFTELESFSPLYTIRPGQTVSYWEKWFLF